MTRRPAWPEEFPFTDFFVRAFLGPSYPSTAVKKHRTPDKISLTEGMSVLSKFFKESDTTLGVFNPNHYLVAVLPGLNAAQQVREGLRNVGFSRDNVIAVSGGEFIELTKEETGPGNLLMQALSRFIGTEQIYADHDLKHARHGAGFVAVYCPNETAKDRAWAIIGPASPLDARYYSSGCVEHLAGDRHTH